MAQPPRRLALHLRCKPNSCQSCCRVKSTLVDPLELPRAEVSGLMPQPMREMLLVMSLPLHPPLQEVNVIITGSSSTGSTKMGFIHNYIWVTTCNHLPPPQPSVWLSVTQIGRTKFLSQNFPFWPFLMVKVQIPLSGTLFASKFSLIIPIFIYIQKKQSKTL